MNSQTKFTLLRADRILHILTSGGTVDTERVISVLGHLVAALRAALAQTSTKEGAWPAA